MKLVRSGAALLLGAPLVCLVLIGAAESPTPFVSGPPLAQTGGFGEPTCHSCHNELVLDSPDAGTLDLGGLPDTYEPGRSYLLSVALRSQDMTRAGFEIAFRFAGSSAPGRQAGRLEAVDDRVTVGYLGLTPVYYAFHTRIGSDVPITDATAWTFEWTAPESSKAVVVHLVGNSANGDDSPLGDFILTLSDTIEATP